MQLQSDGPIDLFEFLSSRPTSSSQAKLTVISHDLYQRWKSGRPMKVEEYIEQFPEFANDPNAIIELVKTERNAAFGIDTKPEFSEVAKRFPDIASQLLEAMNTIDSKTPESIAPPDAFSTLSGDFNSSEVNILTSRYRMLRVLGQGAFGSVYLAVDIELERQVAIKVPLPDRFHGSEDADAYLAEARTVAKVESSPYRPCV